MRGAVFTTVMLLVMAAAAAGQQPADPPPIIDMHLHAQNLWTEPGAPEPLTGLPAAASSEDLQRSTLAALERHNIVTAVASGGLAERYRAAAPDRILASPLLTDASVSPDSLRVWFESDRYQALAEFAPQYAGLAPDDPALEPYFALAEELDVPVGIHMGLGAPGAAYGGTPAYRMAHSDPLLLEDVLVRHPDLRLYVMHAGWPMLDEMVGLLYAHPQVYVDIAVINWALPRAEFHAYLRRLVEAGFGKRIMFGSDQMVWPGAIGRAIEGVESADFLSQEQKRDIFYDNAARFLRLDSSATGRPMSDCRDGDPEAAIAELRETYMRAFNEGRIDEVIDLHAEDVISMPAGMPLLEGREALRDLTTESFRNAPEGFRFAFEAKDLRIADGWAVERGITRAHMDDEGPGIPGGKYVMLYERDDEGCWRIAWSITNSDRPREGDDARFRAGR